MSINSADGVSKKDKYRNYWVLINAFWIRLRFVKYRFVRYWFRFLSRPWLDTGIPNKYFVCLQAVFKTCLQDVFESCLQDIFSVTICRLPRRLARWLQDVFETYLQDVFKTLRRLGRWKIVTRKTGWRRLQDQQMFAGFFCNITKV